MCPGPLLLKGLALYLAKLPHLWKSRNSGLRKWDLASDSALWCGPLSPNDKDFGPGHTYTPPPQTHTLQGDLEAPPGDPSIQPG